MLTIQHLHYTLIFLVCQVQEQNTYFATKGNFEVIVDSSSCADVGKRSFFLADRYFVKRRLDLYDVLRSEHFFCIN